MTPAQQKGLEIGKQYRVTGGDEHNIRVGSIVTFLYDDGTIQPKFSCSPADSNHGYTDDYIYLRNVEPVAASNPAVIFEDRKVEVETTVIGVHRKLTEAERAAITKIIVQGVEE